MPAAATAAAPAGSARPTTLSTWIWSTRHRVVHCEVRDIVVVQIRLGIQGSTTDVGCDMSASPDRGSIKGENQLTDMNGPVVRMTR